LKNHAFQIYNASAGSGKTYTLVKEYLKIILSSVRDDAYRNILAITFTNKAVEEMKSRIVWTLEEFSKDQPSPKIEDMFFELVREIGKNPKEIQEKSKRILKNIIHNYALFDILTIDKFTHRIIRSFAFDLGLSISFEASIETDEMLSQAVDSLIYKAGEEKNLTKLLVNFAIEKTNENKSWDVTREFLESSNLLKKESDRAEILQFQDKNIDDFFKIKQDFYKISENLKTEVITIANNILKQIDNKGILRESFYRSYVPNHIKKIANGVPEINDTHYKYLDQNLEDSKPRYANSVPQNQKDLIDEIALDILEQYKKINQKLGECKFCEAFIKNLTPISVLNNINKEFVKIQQDQNIILVSEFNEIIHKELKDQPAPFIYERLGDRYNHFFIDEFQDTSQMQWENIIPLIDNAISGQDKYGVPGSLMIVGDPKQSIYRFRDGKAEQFIELTMLKNPFSNPDIGVKNLETNYRSFSEIIEFNNHFFNFLANEFSNENYKNIYLQNSQKTNNNIGGYVNISFIDNTDLPEDFSGNNSYQNNNDSEDSEEKEGQKPSEIDNLYLSSVLKTIETARNNGFEYDEIAILVFKNAKAKLIAGFLTENNIPNVSTESLSIGNSDEVIFLINFLEFIKNKNNLQAKANFLYYLAVFLEINSIHDFIKSGVAITNENHFENWLKEHEIEFSFEEIRKKSMYEVCEMLIEIFLNKANNVYIQSFLDLVIEQNVRNQSNIDDFLDFWQKEGYKKSIPSPQGNAIQIMSVHKSKGLEFPVVIFPFADTNYSHHKSIGQKQIWIDNHWEDIELTRLLITNKLDVQDYSQEAKQIWQKVNQEELLDNINLIYVAFTRAAEQLHIISKMNFKKGNILTENRTSSFLIRFLRDEKGVFDMENFNYSFGNPQRKSVKKTIQDNQKTNRSVKEKFNIKNIRIATLEAIMWNTKRQESIEYGNLLHTILSDINSQKDFNKIIDFSTNKGLISIDKKEEIENVIQGVIQHPELRDFYNPNYKILNERAIIRKGKPLTKPDKIVIKPNNQVMILDYKTGEKNQKHKDQIENYAQTLQEMDFKVTKKTLVYIGENIEVVSL